MRGEQTQFSEKVYCKARHVNCICFYFSCGFYNILRVNLYYTIGSIGYSKFRRKWIIVSEVDTKIFGTPHISLSTMLTNMDFNVKTMYRRK